MASLQPPIFSARELEFIREFATGKSNSEIAQSLGLANSTIAVMKLNVREKIKSGVDTEVRLYKWVLENVNLK